MPSLSLRAQQKEFKWPRTSSWKSAVSGLGCGQGSPAGHSLALHLLLLLEDLVGFHGQPLLHEELLPLQLMLPHLLQPFPVCHEQLPALSWVGKEAQPPRNMGSPRHRGHRGHRFILDLQLQLRWRWSGCGCSSGHSRPMETGEQSAGA